MHIYMYISIRLHLYFYKLYICMHTDASIRLFLALFHSISLTRCHSPSLFLSCACECLEKENFPVLFQIEDAQLCNLHTNGLADWLTACRIYSRIPNSACRIYLTHMQLIAFCRWQTMLIYICILWWSDILANIFSYTTNMLCIALKNKIMF